jgi:hypothetical protein
VGIKTLHWIEFGQHISFEELVGLEIELGMHKDGLLKKGGRLVCWKNVGGGSGTQVEGPGHGVGGLPINRISCMST